MNVQNLLFCARTLCLSYVTSTFPLVGSSEWSKQLLCILHGHGQTSEQNPTTKNFDGFHNHSPTLTMTRLKKVAKINPRLCHVHCTGISDKFSQAMVHISARQIQAKMTHGETK